MLSKNARGNGPRAFIKDTKQVVAQIPGFRGSCPAFAGVKVLGILIEKCVLLVLEFSRH